MGRNEYGQLADNTTEGRPLFAPMAHAWPAGVAVTAISAGYRFTMVLAGMLAVPFIVPNLGFPDVTNGLECAVVFFAQ